MNRDKNGRFIKGHTVNVGTHQNPALAFPLEKDCQLCGKKFSAFYPDMSKFRRKKFCSKVCVDKNTAIERTGEKSWIWKGGVTPEHTKIRRSKKYREWRVSVFERDCYKCVQCGTAWNEQKGNESNIQADHIKEFHKYPELRFTLSNGRTLCKSCHYKTENYGGKNNKKRV